MYLRRKQKQTAQEAASASAGIALTRRETEIILLHMKGKNRKDIARILKIELSTVDAHTQKIHHKTGTHDVTGVIKYGHDHHLGKVQL